MGGEKPEGLSMMNEIKRSGVQRARRSLTPSVVGERFPNLHRDGAW